MRDLRLAAREESGEAAELDEIPGSDRARRIRDAVEAALSDIILLGTEEHVRLASRAAIDMATGRPIHTAELVVSLRNFIRTALDLGPIPDDIDIPLQGPARTQGGTRGKSDGNREGGRNAGRGGGLGGAGIGMGVGLGIGQGQGQGQKENDRPD